MTPSPENLLLYKAVGIVKGQYFPSTKFRTGILVTDDERQYPCSVDNIANRILTSCPDLVNYPQVWMVYPKTISHEPGLDLNLNKLYLSPDKLEEIKNKIDYFQIAGEVMSVDDGIVTVCIKRNVLPPEGQAHWKLWQSFNLKKARATTWSRYCRDVLGFNLC